jgi:acetyltransferase-like isoleucine patch superfamily enzyme
MITLKIVQSILFKFFPELKVLKKRISWEELVDFKSDLVRSENSKLNPPYNIQNVSIGDYSYIGRNSFISNTRIGKFCSIGPNFFCGWGIHPTNGISTSPMFYSAHKQNGMTLSKANKIEERKPIEIGNDVFIGVNVTVLDGIKINDGVIIGAGAVVNKDIPPYAIAVGCPIRIIKYRFDKKQIDALLKIKWWDFPETQLQDIEKLFFDIDTFIEKYGKKNIYYNYKL